MVKYIMAADFYNTYVQSYINIMLKLLHYKAVIEIFCIQTPWESKTSPNVLEW
jgi:hypothetical protein